MTHRASSMFATGSSLARMYGLLPTGVVRGGGRKIIAKLLALPYARRTYVVIAKPLERYAAPVAPAPDHERMEVRVGTEHEIIRSLGTGVRARRRVLGYLARNYQCALGFVNDDVAAWCWWVDAVPSGGRRDVDEQVRFFDVEVRPGDAWCFGNYLRAAYRGNGRSVRFLRGLERLLARRGYSRVIGYVDQDNLPARWTYETVGWHPVRTVDATYLLSLVGRSQGRLVVRNTEWRAPATFPYRPVRDDPLPRRRREERQRK